MKKQHPLKPNTQVELETKHSHIETGLHELYQKDPTEADRLLFGREPIRNTRRGFLKGLSRLSTVLGAEIVFSQFMPAGMIPAALADSDNAFRIQGKHPGLVVLNDRPVNAETPAHLLDPKLTPTDLFFVRNNGIPPTEINAKEWTITIDGEAIEKPVSYSLNDLKKKFKTVSYNLTLECGGNGRSEFFPPAKGNQWSTGAVGCAKWTGVRLADVLKEAGIRSDAVYIGYTGADMHLSGDKTKRAISRGVPLEKAMQKESLIAWAMNDQDLPLMNGYPARLVFGGWPASTSGKWLKNIHIRNRVHDGEKMGGSSYRVPCHPVAPGTKVPSEEMCIIHAMPVKSLITYPKSGIEHALKNTLSIRGHAWAGDTRVKALSLSIDFGQTWQNVALSKAENLNAWQHFKGELRFPKTGYYEVWARATDAQGRSQPMLVPGWNPKGYLNNACHRIAVKVI